MSDPSASMLYKAIIENAERNEFSNSARDMFRLVQNNYNFNREGENSVHELHDAIVYLLNVVPPFLEEVRKNDRTRATVSETTSADGSDPLPQAVSTDHTPQSSIPEGDLVEISDIVPADPSSLPVSSIADRYTRSMLKCLRGYPLYDPKPFSELSTEYPRNGVQVGDVGFVRGTGTFDFLFNICPSQNSLINPPNLPDGFSLKTSECSGTRGLEPLLRNTSFFDSPITKTSSGEYICEGSEGAILELPEGAIQDEAMTMLPLKNLAACYGVQWYKYALSRGRDISNGSLYLITSSTKCTQWGIAVFDRPCASGEGSTFVSETSFPFSFWESTSTKYHWKRSSSNACTTKVANPNEGDAPNQCLFLRGYKIMIRQDIFDNLHKDQLHEFRMARASSSPKAGSSSPTATRQRASRIRGGAGPDPSSRLTGGSPLTWTTNSTVDEVALRANFNRSLIHPSDLINAALLSQVESFQNLGAKVALTHDDIWCNLLWDNFPKLNYTTLINIAQSYTSMLDEYGCISLEHNVLTAMANLASTYSNQGKWKEAESLEVKVMEASKEKLGAHHPDTLRAMGILAVTYWNQGKWKEAESLQVEVMEASKEKLGAHHPDTLRAMGILAVTYWNQGKWKEAESLQVEVMEASKEKLGALHPDTLRAMGNLALTYSNQGKWKEAESLQVEVMEASKEKLGALHPDTLRAMGNLALTYSNQGKWKEAESLEVKVVEARQEILGALHPYTVRAVGNLALTYSNRGKWKEAESLQVKVMEASKEKLGPLHPDTLTAMGNLALTYSNQGKWKEAESLEVKVMEASKEILGTHHPDTLTAMGNLASTYRNQGKWKEAESLEVKVMEEKKELLGALHPDTLRAMGNLAVTYRKQNRLKEARELLDVSIKGMQQVLGAEHPTTIQYMKVLIDIAEHTNKENRFVNKTMSIIPEIKAKRG